MTPETAVLKQIGGFGGSDFVPDPLEKRRGVPDCFFPVRTAVGRGCVGATIGRRKRFQRRIGDVCVSQDTFTPILADAS